MGLESIRKNILKDAAEKSAEISGEASGEASRIRKEASEKAKSMRKAAEAEAVAEAERLRKEAEAGTGMEANSMLLAARGEVIERSLPRVMSEVRAELSKNYMKKIFDSGMRQFSQIAGKEEMMVKTSKKNAELLKNFAGYVRYESVNGFIFSTKDGKVSLDAEIDGIMKKQEDYARKEVGTVLFGSKARTSARRQRKARKAPNKKPKVKNTKRKPGSKPRKKKR